MAELCIRQDGTTCGAEVYCRPQVLAYRHDHADGTPANDRCTRPPVCWTCREPIEFHAVGWSKFYWHTEDHSLADGKHPEPGKERCGWTRRDGCPGCGRVLDAPYESGRSRIAPYSPLAPTPTSPRLYQHEHQDGWVPCPGPPSDYCTPGEVTEEKPQLPTAMKSDSDKLRTLAEWFDLTYPTDDDPEVQRDLRRIADRIEALEAERAGQRRRRRLRRLRRRRHLLILLGAGGRRRRTSRPWR